MATSLTDSISFPSDLESEGPLTTLQLKSPPLEVNITDPEKEISDSVDELSKERSITKQLKHQIKLKDKLITELNIEISILKTERNDLQQSQLRMKNEANKVYGIADMLRKRYLDLSEKFRNCVSAENKAFGLVRALANKYTQMVDLLKVSERECTEYKQQVETLTHYLKQQHGTNTKLMVQYNKTYADYQQSKTKEKELQFAKEELLKTKAELYITKKINHRPQKSMMTPKAALNNFSSMVAYKKSCFNSRATAASLG